MEKIQTTIDSWDGVAKITGGTIAHGKNRSWWYLIHFVWDDARRWTYGDLKYLQLDNLSCINDRGETIELAYISFHDNQEMFRVRLAPDSNNNK